MSMFVRKKVPVLNTPSFPVNFQLTCVARLAQGVQQAGHKRPAFHKWR